MAAMPGLKREPSRKRASRIRSTEREGAIDERHGRPEDGIEQPAEAEREDAEEEHHDGGAERQHRDDQGIDEEGKDAPGANAIVEARIVERLKDDGAVVGVVVHGSDPG
jgi:hypothetical protein